MSRAAAPIIPGHHEPPHGPDDVDATGVGGRGRGIAPAAGRAAPVSRSTSLPAARWLVSSPAAARAVPRPADGLAPPVPLRPASAILPDRAPPCRQDLLHHHARSTTPTASRTSGTSTRRSAPTSLARYHRLAGRRRLLPHRHRRARHQDGQDGRRARASSRWRWPTKNADVFRERLEGARRHQRRLHPHDASRATSRPCRRSSAGCVATGDIYLGGYEGWYDEGQEEFVTETEAKDGRVQVASSAAGRSCGTRSRRYFFRLTKYVAAGARVHRGEPASSSSPRVAAERGAEQAASRASRICRSAGRR